MINSAKWRLAGGVFALTIVLLAWVLFKTPSIGQGDLDATEQVCSSIKIGMSSLEVQNLTELANANHRGIGSNWQPVGFGLCHCSLFFEESVVVRKGLVQCHT
jgi:hypothetical protein